MYVIPAQAGIQGKLLWISYFVCLPAKKRELVSWKDLLWNRIITFFSWAIYIFPVLDACNQDGVFLNGINQSIVPIAPNWFFKRDTITQVYSSFPEEKWQDQPDRSIDPALSVNLHILWYTFHCFLDVLWPSTFCLLSNFTHFHGKLLWVPYIISLVAKEIEASVLRGLLKPSKNSGYLFRISGWLRTNLEGMSQK